MARSSQPHWSSRVLAVVVTLLVHLILATPLVLGTAEHRKRTADGVGTTAYASRGDLVESMVLLDLSALSASESESPAPPLASEGITPAQLELMLASSEPQPPPELKTEDFEDSETTSEAAGDPAGNAALFGRYMGQIVARIERAWMRPRSAIEGGRFECRTRITQDDRGNVQSIEIQDCSSDDAWRNSLTTAIKRASPLSAPPEPWLFTRTLTLMFAGDQYAANQTPEYDYEPVNTRMAMSTSSSRLLRESTEPDDKPAALDGNGDVELTIVGSEVRWTETAPTPAPIPR